MVVRKNIVTCILLSIITCGLYGIYWFITLTDDVKTVSNDQNLSGVRAFLFTLITCGIYGFYQAYVMDKDMAKAKEAHGFHYEDNSVLYLILQIIGLGIVNYCLIQNDLNSIADKNETV